MLLLFYYYSPSINRKRLCGVGAFLLILSLVTLLYVITLSYNDSSKCFRRPVNALSVGHYKGWLSEVVKGL